MEKRNSTYNLGNLRNLDNFENIEIIHETPEYSIISKPAGIMVHGDGRSDEKTLSDWILKTYPKIKEVGEHWEDQKGNTILRPGIVHRLDRETSGVMVIARTQEMFDHLKNQFKERLVSKTYHAFVYGDIKHESGEIDRPIGRSNKDFRQYSAGRGARGQLREAFTEYEILKRGEYAETEHIKKECFNYIVCKPRTGRTHQIRVHMKYLNYPIVGDVLYSGKKIGFGVKKATQASGVYALGFERHALHAKTLAFKGLGGEEILYEAQLPQDFQKALELF